jgi:hypothetical protein
VKVYFSDWFGVAPETLEEYGAFNVSLINDLPLFIDPFLLFTSDKPEYQLQHDRIIEYLSFLRDKSVAGNVSDGLIQAWYMFPEVEQLWLGFSQTGNKGRGLGDKFARALNSNLNVIFQDFGKEKVTKGSHIEKVCLVREGVGRDNISDFTANLIMEFLADYTQEFAAKHIQKELRRDVSVRGVKFDYDKEFWCPRTYNLPFAMGNYVLLTPRDLLTRDETWINRKDMLDSFINVAKSSENLQLRSQVNEYLTTQLRRKSTEKQRRAAYDELIRKYPELIEWYIKYKEDRGGEAQASSDKKVTASEEFYIHGFGRLIDQLEKETGFYKCGIDTLEEARIRVQFLKQEIENNGAWRIFWYKGQPIQREDDTQILFRLTWFASPSDFNSEVDNGRGPVDFKVSRGSKDKSLVEFKLAKNAKLKQGLEKQVRIYEDANRTEKSLKVIFYFTAVELGKVNRILKQLKLEDEDSIILVDCRRDNKTSASNA